MLGTMVPSGRVERNESTMTWGRPERPGKVGKEVRVTFYFLGSLAMRLRKDGCVMHMAPGTTLRGGLEAVARGARNLGVELDGSRMKAFVNGAPGQMSGMLAEGSEVLLVPSAVLFDRPERVQESGERRGIASLHQHATLS